MKELLKSRVGGGAETCECEEEREQERIKKGWSDRGETVVTWDGLDGWRDGFRRRNSTGEVELKL